jgi:hypothetical protein
MLQIPVGTPCHVVIDICQFGYEGLHAPDFVPFGLTKL